MFDSAVQQLILDRTVVIINERESNTACIGIITGHISDTLVYVHTTQRVEPVVASLPVIRVLKDEELNNDLRIFQRAYIRSCAH